MTTTDDDIGVVLDAELDQIEASQEMVALERHPLTAHYRGCVTCLRQPGDCPDALEIKAREDCRE